MTLAAGGAFLTGVVTSTSETPSNCIICVATSGDDSNDGRRWSSAFANVQPAIEKGTQLVNNGDCSAVEVWVAEGTYKPTYLDDSTDARTATFQLAANVALYGGFAGTESQRSDRNIDSHVTILTGDIGNQDDTKDNSYHVVMGETDATLDGFTVTGGNANAPYAYNPDRDASVDHSKSYGGGMLNDGASPTVANCTFVSNSATQGSGMYNSNSWPVVNNCAFTNNDGGSNGGSVYGSAMYNSNSSPTVTNCAFTKNGGGGMYNDDSLPTVTNCTFSGGGMYNYAGSPRVNNCKFTDNAALFWGFGMGAATQGGGMYNDLSSPIITNCTFANNTADWGAGIYNSGGSPIITNCTFIGNVAYQYGGGINNQYGDPIVTNCTFANNSATAVEGGGMYSNGGSPVITNCIFWNDTSGWDIREQFDNSTVSNCIVQYGYESGTNIIVKDPLFVDPANGDFRLSAGSPAIDKGGCASGLAATDMLGNPRWDIANVKNGPGSNGVDIGAYEYQGNAGTDSVVTDLGCQ
jgi:hypothetical protein